VLEIAVNSAIIHYDEGADGIHLVYKKLGMLARSVLPVVRIRTGQVFVGLN